MVNGSNNTINCGFCFRLLLCNLYQRFWMFFNIYSDNGNGKCSTSNADNHSERSNNILRGRFSDINIFASDR